MVTVFREDVDGISALGIHAKWPQSETCLVKNSLK